MARGTRVIGVDSINDYYDPALKHARLARLTERYGDTIRDAKLVSCPGCYPTAALLALEPLNAAGLVQGPVMIDAKSGISGAGKSPTERTHFSENHGSVSAYGIFSHRHTAEIEQELGRPVTFVPHLVPLDRGILVDLTDVEGSGLLAIHDAS